MIIHEILLHDDFSFRHSSYSLPFFSALGQSALTQTFGYRVGAQRFPYAYRKNAFTLPLESASEFGIVLFPAFAQFILRAKNLCFMEKAQGSQL